VPSKRTVWLLCVAACGGKAVVDGEPGDTTTTTTTSTTTSTTTTTTSTMPPGLDVCAACVGQIPQPAGVVAATMEASGLAASGVHRGVLYTHDDSGGPAAVFALSGDGDLLATGSLAIATNVDWEDAAVGRCGDNSCIYIGDIGDNALVRSSYQIYRIVEPDPIVSGNFTYDVIDFVYPDGSHDAEALLVDEKGQVHVITKTDSGPSNIYAFPADPPTNGVITVAWVGNLQPSTGIQLITAADMAEGGVLIRTYTNVLFYPAAGDVASTLAGAPCLLPAPPEIQAETIAWYGSGYATLSEGVDQTLYRVTCR
jgi:hypothetical protein